MKSLIKLLSDARPSKFSAACAYAFCSIQNLIKSVSDARYEDFSMAPANNTEEVDSLHQRNFNFV